MPRTGPQIVWDAYKAGVLSAEDAIKSLKSHAKLGGTGGTQAARLLRHFGVEIPGVEQGTTGAPAPTDPDASTFSFEEWWEAQQGSGGGGGGYRPQTAEEAANLLAQSKLFGAQAKNIPQAQELARRKTFAEIGLAQAERAANPRRIFEAIYGQARLKLPELAKSLQEKVNLPGFSRGASVRTERGSSQGKAVAGPVLALVGKDDDEYALLPPGSVIAPKKAGDGDDVETAKLRIAEQMEKGGSVSPEKAREMLHHGEVRGEPLTERQRGLFGLIASGKKPTRLKKAQGGLDVFGLPPEVIAELEKLRKQTTEAVTGATRAATGGTSLFDPVGGSTFTEGQADFFGGLNLREFAKLSPTQRKAAFSTLSANRVEPEDFLESLTRQFAGFNPVKTGTRARFAGILGR